jgi:1,5-anhydro-D-fructose reductase (1,5-anhydro-D-mannitol-forming)
MVRVAMLSFAHVHANGYASQVSENPDAEIVCIWDHDAERGKAAAERWKVPFCPDLEAVLSNPEVDGVVLNSETDRHTELILAAVAHGKHVFTEKALTVTTKDADKVVKAVRDAGIKFMISLPSRCASETLFMKRLIDDGILGEITLMRARIAHSAALDRWFHGGSAWFGDAKAAGGGALFDLGCHTVDVMRWFLGEPEAAVARVSNFSGSYNIDDNCVMVVEFKNRAMGILDVSWVHRAGPNLWEIYGTEGCVVRGMPGQSLVYTSRKVRPLEQEAWISPTELPKPLPSPMNQWIAAILRDEPMTITVEDGRNLTEMLEACYLAAREGREVRFPLG